MNLAVIFLFPGGYRQLRTKGEQQLASHVAAEVKRRTVAYFGQEFRLLTSAATMHSITGGCPGVL